MHVHIEYIQNLESIKNKQEEEINVLKQALLHLQEENVQLKQEVEELRKLGQPNKLPHSPATVTPADFNITASKFNGNSNLQRNNIIKRSSSSLLTNVHQSASPVSRQLVIPNVNKDTPSSPSSSSSKAASKNIWQDSRVRVQTTFI